ncbi:general odorant-binding protein 56a [Drosophila erecta]|uniref:Odorant-binding protein 56b n=1 Tax=Drosophila erecta TaxID=7220 RepID=B3NJT2_DROER|nr:general odorant-binding protein 56a [Drosophila erecta]EDV55247.1 Odorant-binding protein 56b [Drosophila erecta]
MKLICLLVVFLVFALSELAAGQTAADSAAYKQMQQACIKELNIAASDANLLTNDKEVANPSESVKCYHSCVYKKLGLLGDDGKPNTDKIVKFAQLRFSSLPVDKLKGLLTSCVATKAAATCDLVYNMEKCVVKGISA